MYMAVLRSCPVILDKTGRCNGYVDNLSTHVLHLPVRGDNIICYVWRGMCNTDLSYTETLII